MRVKRKRLSRLARKRLKAVREKLEAKSFRPMVAQNPWHCFGGIQGSLMSYEMNGQRCLREYEANGRRWIKQAKRLWDRYQWVP